jgi:hypothetical protein
MSLHSYFINFIFYNYDAHQLEQNYKKLNFMEIRERL